MKFIILILNIILVNCTKYGYISMAIKIPKKFAISDETIILFNLLENNQLNKFKKNVNIPIEELNTIYKDKTLLMIAAEKGYEDIVMNLIRMGANVNRSNSERKTALYFAYKFENESVKNILLDNGAYLFGTFWEEVNLNKCTREKKKIIENYENFSKKSRCLLQNLSDEYAFQNGLIKVLKEGVDFNFRNLENGEADFVSTFKRIEFLNAKDQVVVHRINLLVAYKLIDLDVCLERFTYKDIYEDEKYETLFEVLLIKNIIKKKREVLIDLITNASLNKILLGRGFYFLNMLYIDNHMSLYDFKHLSEIFFKKGLNLNIEIRDNKPLLGSLIKITRISSEQDKDKETRKNELKNFLIHLVKENDIKRDVLTKSFIFSARVSALCPNFLILFMEKGLDIDLRDDKGNTALLHAILLSEKETVKLLIEKGAILDARNSDGINALKAAFSPLSTFENPYGYPDKEIIKLLIKERVINLESILEEDLLHDFIHFLKSIEKNERGKYLSRIEEDLDAEEQKFDFIKILKENIEWLVSPFLMQAFKYEVIQNKNSTFYREVSDIEKKIYESCKFIGKYLQNISNVLDHLTNSKFMISQTISIGSSRVKRYEIFSEKTRFKLSNSKGMYKYMRLIDNNKTYITMDEEIKYGDILLNILEKEDSENEFESYLEYFKKFRQYLQLEEDVKEHFSEVLVNLDLGVITNDIRKVLVEAVILRNLKTDFLSVKLE